MAVSLLLGPVITRADIADSTENWDIVLYPGTGEFDFANDQQTGNRDSDIVGNGTHAAFYTRFDGLGTDSVTDGLWSARVRLGSDRPQSGTFDNNLFVGIDGNLDGAIDLFVGVDNQGGNQRLAIWDPGSGANTSPSTTSIVSPAVYYTPQTTSNYLFTAVNSTNDPFATDFDLDLDGDTDFFLSFSIDFQEIVNQMNAVAGISIDEGTAISFVLATANSDNSLNQDLNGANGGIGSSSTWSELGVLSNPVPFRGTPIPEPSAASFFTLALIGMLAVRKRKSA